MLVRFARRVESEIGVTVSVGLSDCKFLAKLASDLDKPRGFALLRRDEAKAWLAPQSVGRLWGVGRAGQERLERLGFRLIGDLQRIDEWAAASSLGDDGRRLWRLAQGLDDRRVSPDRKTKSISSETTFDCDVADKEELTRVLLGHCDRVAARLRKEGLAASGGHAEVAAARFQPQNAEPNRHEADPTRAPPVRRRASAAGRSAQTERRIAFLESPGPISRRPRAPTRTISSTATPRGRSPAKRRSRACATSSALVPSSAASPFGKPRARLDARYFVAGRRREDFEFPKARAQGEESVIELEAARHAVLVEIEG